MDDGATWQGVVDDREAGGGDTSRSRRLPVFAAAAAFLVVFLVSGEVIAAVAVAAVVYAFVHENLSDDEADGGDVDEDVETPQSDTTPSDSLVDRPEAGYVEGPTGEVLATTPDDRAVDARYDVVVTSPHPVEIELRRTDISEGERAVRRLSETLGFEDLDVFEHVNLDPPIRVTEEVRRRVRNDLDTRSLRSDFGEEDLAVGVASVVSDGDYDRYRYEVSYSSAVS